MKQRVAYVAPYVRPGGGPAGYLYNLRAALAEHVGPQTLIDIFSASERQDRQHDFSTTKGRLTRLLDTMPAMPAARVSLFREKARWRSTRTVALLAARLGLYPVVVFHDVVMAAQYLALPEGRARPASQRIVVMTHSPTDFSSEVVEGWRLRFGDGVPWWNVVAELQRLELNIYDSVDELLGPCPEAFDAYFTSDETLRSRFLQVPLKEALTGVKAPVIGSARETYRNKLAALFGESLNSTIVVGYFGRFHPHKGFDLFHDIVRCAARQEGSRLRFVVAGAGPLDVPQLPHLVNLGWQSEELFSYLSAIDVVMSCNRVSYFDLASLEAIAMGKPVLATPVGGNRKIAQLAPGYVLFDGSADDAYEWLTRLSPHDLDHLSEENRSAHARWFSDAQFAQNHQSLAERWLSLPGDGANS